MSVIVKKRVLVVDDDPMVRSAIIHILGRQGLVVSGANSVDEAREMILAGRNPAMRYNLIMLDVKLGKDDGIAFLSELRNQHAIDMPIMLITGEFDLDRIKEAAQHQIKGFIIKPFTAEILEKKVLQYLE